MHYLEEPDRVPVLLPVGSYPAYYAGSSFYNIMYDYDELKRCWIRFMDDFGDMDTFMGLGLIPSGNISDALDIKIWKPPTNMVPIKSCRLQVSGCEIGRIGMLIIRTRSQKLSGLNRRKDLSCAIGN
jgi:hypothetical protein